MRFRIRLHDPRLFTGNPGGLVLELIRGNTTDVFAVSRADLAALNSLVAQMNSGVPLPIETGDDTRGMPTGSFPQVGAGPMMGHD